MYFVNSGCRVVQRRLNGYCGPRGFCALPQTLRQRSANLKVNGISISQPQSLTFALRSSTKVGLALLSLFGAEIPRRRCLGCEESLHCLHVNFPRFAALTGVIFTRHRHLQSRSYASKRTYRDGVNPTHTPWNLVSASSASCKHAESAWDAQVTT